MARAKQLNFFDPQPIAFGGSLARGRRKTARPLDFKRPTHLVLKATNSWRLLRNKNLVLKTINRLNSKFGVRMFESGVHADHVHLLVQFGNRTLYRRWIRSVTGLLARAISGLKWRHRPFTRIVNWKRDYKQVQRYVRSNRVEGEFLNDGHSLADTWATRLRVTLGKQFEVVALL